MFTDMVLQVKITMRSGLKKLVSTKLAPQQLRARPLLPQAHLIECPLWKPIILFPDLNSFHHNSVLLKKKK